MHAESALEPYVVLHHILTAFCSGVHHVMSLLHITAGLRAMDFGRVDVTVPMNDDDPRVKVLTAVNRRNGW